MLAQPKPERGQSLVEFALVVPILFVAIMGLIQFGVGVYAQTTATSAAQNGARVAGEQDKGLADGIVKAREIISHNFGSEVANNAQIDAVLIDGGENVQLTVKVTIPTFVPFLGNALRFTFSSKATVFKEQWINE